ncbi:MAG: arginine--tRNA ligase [Propionibacteriaceae bacterium]
MTSLPQQINDRLAQAAGADPELRGATKPEFGHFQSSVAMRLAKQQGKNPREVAAQIVADANLDDLCEPLEIAGPGFINIRLKPQVLAAAATAVLNDPACGISLTSTPQRVVIDYSAPNVAKQMHVGHLRTTIIGDCFNRVLTAKGHTVIPQNHLGDWGTQFGMLVAQIIEEDLDVSTLTLDQADALYKRSKKHFDADVDFADRARKRVVALQGGDEETLKIWQSLIDVSMAGFNELYARLNVKLTDADVAGESTYNDALPQVAADLEQRGVAVIDNGALCVFVEGFQAPLIIRKGDGGFGYDTTDMAAIKYRCEELKADRVIYVTDARQSQHFQQIFGAARKAGYLPESVVAEHVGYGMVLGNDGKPFKTREGTAVGLAALLDEAEQHAAPEIALAAIKYADLSNAIIKDYVFDAARMTATTGNTGPYLQYAHARTQRILRQPELAQVPADAVTMVTHPAEDVLAMALSRFGEVVDEVAETLQPHKLCGYLYEVAVAYSTFYENCPIRGAEGETQSSRLALNAATGKVLKTGLELLGMAAPESM